MTLVEELVVRARAAAATPDEDALRVRLLVNLAAACGEHDEGRRLRQVVAGQGPGELAFRLGADLHARTQDDFFPEGRSHVGAVVIPAVLGVASAGVGVRPLMPGFAAGYEAMTLVSESYASAAQSRGLRPTGVFGPIGAAAAAATVLDLDDDHFASALALAAAAAAGTTQAWVDGTDEWLVEVAAAARAGTEAALLAEAGVRGSRLALEGDAGWARAYFGDAGATRLAAALEAPPRPAASRVATKLYPISGIAQAPTALACRLGREVEGKPDRIEVRMSPAELDYPGSRNLGPFRGRADALMSVARCVATGYVHGFVPYRSLTRPPTAAEASVLDTVELVPDGDCRETEATVTVTRSGGTERGRVWGGDILFPGYEEVRADLAGLATRSEAPFEVVRGLAGLVHTAATAQELVDTMQRAT